MSRRVTILTITLLVLALLAGCAQAPPTATPRPPTAAPKPTDTPPPPPPTDTPVPEPKVFRYAAVEPDSLDPSKGGSGFADFQNLYEALVDTHSKDGEIKPLAAESFEQSADGLTWTFKLREGLKWSDGQPVVAEDYRYAWLRQLDPAEASYAPDMFYAIKNAKAFNQGEITDRNQVGIQAPDERTLIVTLEKPAPFWIQHAGNTDYFPVRKDIIEQYGDQWMEAGNHVGNGPYMLAEWQHDQKLVFVKNPHYEGPWKDTRHIDRIEITVVQDSQAQGLPLYEAEEIDVATVPSTELDRVQADSVLGEQWRLSDIAGATLLLFDTKNPPTDELLVRQAMALAIDRETLAYQVFKGAYPPTTSFSPPSLSSYEPTSFLGYDPAKARDLLAEAGYPNGEGFPVLDFTYWSIWRGPLSAQTLQAMWKENLNIDVTLNPLEPQAMRDYRISRETEPYNIYYALQWADIADPSTWHNSQLDPDQNVRHTRYDNPEYVQLIRDALNETDFAKRKEMYQQAEAMVNQEVPMLTLLQEAIVVVVKPYLKNYDEVTTTIGQLTRVAQPPGLDIVR